MDRRRLSYASVAGGNSASANTTAGGIFSHFMNPTPSSPIRNSFHHTAHTERGAIAAPPYSPAEDGSKSKQPFWADLAATQIPWHEGEVINGGSQRRMFIRPSYLSGSRYLEKLDVQHRIRLAKEADQKTPSLSKSSSGASLHRMAPSYRGMTYEIVENTPTDSDNILTPPLPSKWGQKDKNGGLEIIGNTEIKYVSSNKVPELEAAATRSDHPIPRRCGIYYYEITVLAKGKDGAIAIGFSSSKAALEKLPGSEPESWAYHGDDGKSFGCAPVGKNCGPVFKVDDVVGCGINFRTGKAFFTHNGSFLGHAFTDLKDILHHKKVYASVGMKRPGGHVKVNFGQAQFYYDIDEFVRLERDLVRERISGYSIDRLHPKLDATELVPELVSQYLRHEGFMQTADSFRTEVMVEAAHLRQDSQVSTPRPNTQDIHALQRQQIRSAVLDGDIDTALGLTQSYYPTVLRTNPIILFRLKCRKFIEMMCLSASTPNRTGRPIRKAKSRYDQEMDIDSQYGYDANSVLFASNPNSPTAQMDDALKYAQELNADYKSDASREVTQILGEIFALFAYEDPQNSPASGLMDIAGRSPVAEGLNSAILVSLGAPSITALETIYQQTTALLEDNIEYGGSGAFIHLDRNIDRSMDVNRARLVRNHTETATV